ncbi:MAG: rhodanese-like domain-containing protein [Thermoplasmata archaeon]|nr:rhodanese-like domain-containing protein [Thermoplasmata archaeon]
MVTILSVEELKTKIDRGDDFKLVMTMNEWHFEAEHIPGSIWVADKERAKALLDPQDEIVCYCSDRACAASRIVSHVLEKSGFPHVYHFDGGLKEWKEAGYPIEGAAVAAS